MDYLGEIAMSSQFKLNLFLSGTGTSENDDLNSWLRQCGIFGDNANDQQLKYDLLCHQAQLPGTQFDLATEKGGFQGVTETFARADSSLNLQFHFMLIVSITLLDYLKSG